MPRKITRTAAIALCFAAPLLSVNAGASTPNGLSILTRALSDGSHKSSMTISGTFSGLGIKASVNGGFTSAAEGGVTSLSGVGSEDIIQPLGKSYYYVKASALAVLKNEFDVTAPTTAEVGVWYEVPKSDPRYDSINTPGGAQTVVQAFSFSTVGWSKTATYEGTAVLKGVRVIKLESGSNLFVTGSGFGKTTLYVTDSSDPLPFAMSGPAGTTGLLYFRKWNDTTVTIPIAAAELPQ